MSDYIIIRHKQLYKVYKKVDNNKDLYQYAGAAFVMLVDAQEFVGMKRGYPNAS